PLAFIEFVRNTPQLGQVVFGYPAVLQTLPSPRQSIIIPGGLLLNIRGLYVPDAVMHADSSLSTWLACFILAATPFVWHVSLAGRRLGATALALPLMAALTFSLGIERVDSPTLTVLNITGGTDLPPELFPLWAGLR